MGLKRADALQRCGARQERRRRSDAGGRRRCGYHPLRHGRLHRMQSAVQEERGAREGVPPLGPGPGWLRHGRGGWSVPPPHCTQLQMSYHSHYHRSHGSMLHQITLLGRQPWITNRLQKKHSAFVMGKAAVGIYAHEERRPGRPLSATHRTSVCDIRHPEYMKMQCSSRRALWDSGCIGKHPCDRPVAKT